MRVRASASPLVRRVAGVLALAVLGGSPVARAGDAAPPDDPPLHAKIEISRRQGEILLDGSLDDPGWKGARRVDRWYEIDPGTNLEPRVRTTAYLTYDDSFLYVGLELDDPEPAKIRAPLTDRDDALTSSDYAGIVIDGADDGRSAQEFLANPRGIQYDGIWNDLTGEDLAPNFYWSSAARIHEHGWTLEMRIPFSSIRYDRKRSQEWGITLFRNWPRQFRYQLASAAAPADAPCFICDENRLVGLTDLPAGGSWVAAPFVVARSRAAPAGGVAGEPLQSEGTTGQLGVDVKWTPDAHHAVDLTVRPDFSQIESDTAQIAANRRFALFYPELRPFFLEQVDLFSTPLPVVYTRTVTDPGVGLRATGRFASTAYTLLAADDRGGGKVVIPGPTSSDLADQDFDSRVFLGRLRRDLGASFVSFVASGREIQGGASNWLAGPDFAWRPRPSDSVVGQVLWSATATPNRPDLAPSWDGRRLAGGAGILQWLHDDGTWDWTLDGRDVAGEFRADNGYLPQVGIRGGTVEAGRSLDGRASISKIRLFSFDQYLAGEGGDVLTRILSGGFELKGAHNLALRVRYSNDDDRVDGKLLAQRRTWVDLELAPSARFAHLVLSGSAGSAIDFDNAREGTGWAMTLGSILRARDHLEVQLDAGREVLDVPEPAGGGSARLYTADLARLRATWTFTPRLSLRAIGQVTETRRDPGLYLAPVAPKESETGGSLLLAYRTDWQSVVYLGFNDLRAFTAATGRDEPTGREIFCKLSYAFRG